MMKDDYKQLNCGASEGAADKLDGEKDKQEPNRSTSTKTRTPCPNYQKKMAFIGHACRNNKCSLVKTCILGMMPGKRRRGALGCNPSITSGSGQGHPRKKT